MTRLALIVALAILLVAHTVRADDPIDAEKQSCLVHFDAAQQLQGDGKLIEARAALELCSAKVCPKAVVEHCIGWLEDIDTTMPTVILAAKGPNGAHVTDVTVREGETAITSSLNGRPIALNPGLHRLVFEHREHGVRELEHMARAGERNQLVEVQFSTPTPPVPRPSPQRVHPTPRPRLPPPSGDDGDLMPVAYVGFGFAAAGLLLGGIMTGVAVQRYNELDERCAVACSESDIAKGRVFAHIATASFITAGVGAAVGTIVIVATLHDDPAGARVTARVGVGGAGLRIRF